MPIEYLASDHAAWQCIYNGDAIGLKGHLREDPSILYKRAEDFFHPGSPYRKLIHTIGYNSAKLGVYASKKVGIIGEIIVDVPSMIVLATARLPLLAYDVAAKTARYTGESITQKTANPRYRSRNYQLQGSIKKNYSLFDYALQCHDLSSIKVIMAFGDFSTYKKILQSFLEKYHDKDSWINDKRIDRMYINVDGKYFIVSGVHDITTSLYHFIDELRPYVEQLSTNHSPQTDPVKREISELKAQNKSLHKELATLQADHQSQTAAMKDEAIRRDREHSQELRRDQSEIERLRAEVDELKKVKENLHKEIESLSKAKAKKEPASTASKISTLEKERSIQRDKRSASVLIQKLKKQSAGDDDRKDSQALSENSLIKLRK